MKSSVNKIGNNIRKYRILSNLTQLQLANKVKVTPAFISQLENNERQAYPATLEKIAKALNITLADLLTEEKTKISDLAQKYYSEPEQILELLDKYPKLRKLILEELKLCDSIGERKVTKVVEGLLEIDYDKAQSLLQLLSS